MPSIFTRIIKSQIRALKPFLQKIDGNVEKYRYAQDMLGNLTSKILAPKVKFLDVESYPPDKANWALPREDVEKGVVLYLHGGGYVMGSLDYARHFASIIAKRCNKLVFCLGYALAPEDPFPAALDDAFEAYKHILRIGTKPDQISVIGESAGGGLLFALMHKLKDEGIELPACLVSISPWVDLTLSSDSATNHIPTDAALTIEQLRYCADAYAPNDKKNKYVSPIYADFEGFPPCLVFASDNEILTDDAVTVKKRCDEAGIECRLVLEKDMWHAYPLYGTRESKRAVVMMDKFLDEYIKSER